MIIKNVGLAMDTLETKNGIVYGNATIYSVDTNVKYDDEYYDDFNFTYDLTNEFVNTNIDEKIFGDYLEVIDVMLVDNLKTNYLQIN